MHLYLNREESLLMMRRRLSETEAEVTRLQRIVHDHDDHDDEASRASRQQQQQQHHLEAQLREREQQLAVKESTLKMAEGRLKEKEGAIAVLEQEKAKLETFAKRTLTHFKEKFLATLSATKMEKQELEKRNGELVSKMEAITATHAREQRLIMSAVYECGVRMMDHNISAQLSKAAASPVRLIIMFCACSSSSSSLCYML